MKKIFLTGVYRSGTTLLDKVLQSHPQLSFFTQPFPSFYFIVKKLFLAEKGIDKGYPIGPDFMANSYSAKDLSEFLNSHMITSGELDTIFEGIKNEKGHLNSGLEKFRSSVKEGLFTEIFESLTNILCENSSKSGVEYVGVKEILCEEFIPGLIKKNIKSISIIRDPRDIICSLNLGKGREYTGEIRPLLYTLRLWRKSVAYAINNKDVSDFIFIRYEDLVSDTEGTLKRITSFLNILPYEKKEYGQPLKDQDGNLWKGNSSFGIYDHIDSGSIGEYKTLLSESSIQYIENVCYPEMKYLGYALENNNPNIDSIRSYKEPYFVNHPNFHPGYTSDKENIAMEIRRINSLREKGILSEAEQVGLFLFPKVYKELKKTV